MNYENIISKIRQFSRKANIAIRVMLVLIAVSGALALISAVMMTKGLTDAGSVTNGAAAVTSTAAAFSQSVKWLISCVILAAVMLTADKTVNVISRYGQPFTESTCQGLKRISVLLVFLALLPSAVGFLLYAVFSPQIMWENLIDIQQFVLSSSMIFTAMIFFIVTKIFDYGCKLQRESDETL